MLPLVFLTAVFGIGSFSMVGCGGSSSGGDKDMAKPTSKPDLLQVVDSAIAKPGCAATLACENACYNDMTKTASQMQDCSTACDGMESDSGAMLEQAIYDCIYTACDANPVVDAGTNGVCAYNPADGNKFITPTPCQACLQMAEQGSCMSTITACQNDTSGQ